MSSDLLEDIPFDTPFAEILTELEASLENVDDSKAFQLAREAIGVGENTGLEEKYLLLSVGEHTVALALTAVAEVAQMPSITRIPNLPAWIRGIVSVHNEILSVVDIAAYMHWDVKKVRSAERMVVIKMNEMKVVAPTSKIIGTHTMQSREESTEDLLQSIFDPRFFRKGKTTQGVDCVVLDHNALLSDERFLHRKM